MSSSDGHWRRLAALAGMLGSDHEGERANAARLATLELRRLGLNWAELIARAFRVLEKPIREESSHYRDERRERATPGRRTSHKDGVNLWEFVRQASLQRQDLSDWDISFLNTFLVIGPKCAATEAQWTQVKRIAAKLAMAA